MAKRKQFDKLYGEFFGSKKKIKELIKNIKNFKFMDINEYNPDDYTLMNEPDYVERFNEGPFEFEKRIWIKPNGDKLIEVVMLENGNPKNEEKDLDKRLANALAIEDYDEAIKIRDLINKKNEK